MSNHLNTRSNDKILHLEINRPERKNALDLDLYQNLSDALKSANSKEDCRVIVLSGAEGNFSSGNDLKDFLNQPTLDEHHPTKQFMQSLYHCEKPVLAALEGFAVGIGTTMLLHCDLVYAHSDTTFQLPFVNLGLIPEFASTFFLPMIAGHLKASELLLLGEPFDAQTALECKLVNHVIQEGSVLDYTMDKAQKIASKSPEAIKLTKQLLKKPYKKMGEEVLEEEYKLFETRLQSNDFKEAVQAFFEKR